MREFLILEGLKPFRDISSEFGVRRWLVHDPEGWRPLQRQGGELTAHDAQAQVEWLEEHFPVIRRASRVFASEPWRLTSKASDAKQSFL